MAEPSQPELFFFEVSSQHFVHSFGGRGGHLTMRNNGVNAVWVSWDGRVWFDIAVGTSFECDQETCHIHFCTQTGHSILAVNWVPWL